MDATTRISLWFGEEIMNEVGANPDLSAKEIGENVKTMVEEHVDEYVGNMGSFVGDVLNQFLQQVDWTAVAKVYVEE
jgi:hypothetical protein